MILLLYDIDLKLLNKLHEPMQHKKRCYTCIQWTRVLYSVVITQQSNPPISQFNRPCYECTSVWSMFVYNKALTQNVNSLPLTFTVLIKASCWPIIWPLIHSNQTLYFRYFTLYCIKRWVNFFDRMCKYQDG